MARVTNTFLRERFGDFDDLGVEHFCIKHPHIRVFPYSKVIQALKVEAPVPGDRGHAVLLQSLNAGLGPNDLRWAVCVECKGVSQCTRRTRGDVVKSLLELRGLRFRETDATRAVARRLGVVPQFVADGVRRASSKKRAAA